MASLTASDIKALEKRYRDGVSSSDIVEVFQKAGERFSEATLRKYVQLNLLPKSKRVGTRGKHKGSSGVYPVSVLRIINDVKRALEAGATLEEIRLASRLNHLSDDQTTRIFFQDVAVYVALSVADVDHFQRRVLELRTPHDPDLLTQLIDLVPPLEGRTIIAIGGLTGMLGFLFREFLKPSALHVFEPQKVLADEK